MLYTFKYKNSDKQFTWDSETGEVSDPDLERIMLEYDKRIEEDGETGIEYPHWSGNIVTVIDPRHNIHDFKAVLVYELCEFFNKLILPEELEKIKLQSKQVDFPPEYYEALSRGEFVVH